MNNRAILSNVATGIWRMACIRIRRLPIFKPGEFDRLNRQFSRKTWNKVGWSGVYNRLYLNLSLYSERLN